MKRYSVFLAAVLLVSGVAATASASGFSLNLPGLGVSVGPPGVGINIGLPWVTAPEPDHGYQPVFAEEPPEFVQPPELGFYVAAGVPFDLFFLNNSYYLCRENVWYQSSYYNGPWSPIHLGNLPHALSRFPSERIRHYRDTYYGHYQRYGAWSGYRHFRPGHNGWGRERVGRYNYDNFRHNGPYQGYGNNRAFTRPYSPGYRYNDRPPDTRPYNPYRGYGGRYATGSYNYTHAYGSRPAPHQPYNHAPGTTGSSFSYGNNRFGYGNTERWTGRQLGPAHHP